ncbi:MAG: sulfurtransferase TusA family protein [Thermoanaerobaculia bacterium]|nr:sulfurtransferase TusA family protein [Thermoanaerobaculia bacterium]
MRYRLDTSGLRCPLPVRLTARRVAQLRPGDELEVIGDDPVMGLDLEAWCFDTGHHLVERGGDPPDPGPMYCRIEIREPSGGEAVRSSRFDDRGTEKSRHDRDDGHDGDDDEA